MKQTVSFAEKFPDLTNSSLNQEVGIVLVNHVGSNCKQDTGRDAQYLADRFRVLAVAADSPEAAMEDLAITVDHLFEVWGVRRAIIAGRSAGGLGALELAATGKISQATLVYAAEPVGCQTFANGDGKRSYNQYLKLQKRLMAGDSKLPEGQRYFIHPRNDAKELPLRAQASRIASMVLLNVAEAYYNESHWGQDVVADYATAISARGVPVHIDFADISMVLPADHAQKSSYLDRLSNGAHRESGVSTREQPGTMHRSFDNRDFFARCLAAAVQQRTGIELPNA